MEYYLGLDSSTQSLKAILIDIATGSMSETIGVNFGNDLPEYNSPNGALPNDDPQISHANPLMWLDALDLLFERLKKAGWPLAAIKGISGSGQQHGSVYVNSTFPSKLAALNGSHSLSSQLAMTFSRKTAPIWMDASTSPQCDQLRQKFGERLRRETGSDAIERFTGPQIMKFAAKQPQAWNETAQIHLVSSFMASILAGKPAPIDYGDGAGMNLLNLRTFAWHEEIAAFMGPKLLEKLPPCMPSTTIYGTLAPYFAKYGFAAGIPLVVWSGDNPCSLIGCGGGGNSAAVISLGTSDTFFGTMASLDDAPRHYGHVFGNPSGGFMSLVCFANGSLAREKLRSQFNMDWWAFNDSATQAIPAKGFLLPYFTPETTPLVVNPKVKADYDMASASPGENIRALLESQALSMRLHAAPRQMPSVIKLTGGASACPVLRQIIADVFQTSVALGEARDSAALGAAMRAANAVAHVPFGELNHVFCKTLLTIQPNTQLAQCYDNAITRYEELEKSLTLI